MEYELYWNKNDDKHVPTDMVISGSFGSLKDARAYAYKKIPKNGKSHLARYTSVIIEIVGVDRDGVLYDCGRVGVYGTAPDIWVAYDPQGRKKTYKLYSDGSIREYKLGRRYLNY